MIGKALLLAVSVAAGSSYAECPEHGSVDIYPTADVLPENLLRMYVYFPRPMAADQGLKNIRLLGASGTPVQGAFLPNREDLWSPDRRRLTVLFDPGRVKTGLNAHEAMGRALVPGQSYTFEVAGEALDENGCAMNKASRFTFVATEADLETPDPADWYLSDPRAGSREAFVVDLGDAHDHLSLAFQLRVVNANGKLVPGAIDLGENEAHWIFTPASSWQNEPYALTVGERLEDLAGNRPGVLFDRPMDEEPVPWLNRLPFTPK